MLKSMSERLNRLPAAKPCLQAKMTPRDVQYDLRASAKQDFQSDAAGLPVLALFGPHAMSDVSPECAPKRASGDHSEFMGSRRSLLCG
jgi:hypothetical protein